MEGSTTRESNKTSVHSEDWEPSISAEEVPARAGAGKCRLRSGDRRVGPSHHALTCVRVSTGSINDEISCVGLKCGLIAPT